MKTKLSMKDDIVFKAFFSKNEQYLKSFLSAILGTKVKIKKVIHDARLEQLTKEMKYGILDLDVELENGEIINIEMQLKNNGNIEERTTFYASKKIVEQLEPAQKYEELKRVIVIAILDYTLTNLPDYIIETTRVVETNKQYELNNIVKYYYIELEKFRNQNPNMDEEQNQWLAFIDMERGDLLEMAKKENKEIKKAFEDYEVLTGDAEVKRLTEIRLMSKLEENSALATAKAQGKEKGMQEGLKEGFKKGMEQGMQKGIEEGMQKGIEEGMQKGIEEGMKKAIEENLQKNKSEKTEIAKKLLKLNIDIKEISEITGISIEEIKKISK